MRSIQPKKEKKDRPQLPKINRKATVRSSKVCAPVLNRVRIQLNIKGGCKVLVLSEEIRFLHRDTSSASGWRWPNSTHGSVDQFLTEHLPSRHLGTPATKNEQTQTCGSPLQTTCRALSTRTRLHRINDSILITLETQSSLCSLPKYTSNCNSRSPYLACHLVLFRHFSCPGRE